MAHRSRHTSPTSPQSPQQGDPFPPQSPQSLSQGDVFAGAYPTAVTTDTSHRVHPASLHLKPVTWESLAQVNFPPGERFEIVDGLLVWLPMGNGTAKHQRNIKALVKFVNQLLAWWAVSGLDVEVESTSNNPNAANARVPDLIITRRRPGSPTASSSPERTPKKHVLLTKDKPAFAVIEVTSESTRGTDLTAKWQQYCKTGVKFYYIVDLYGLETSKEARVIVGSKAQVQGWTRCDSGDPDIGSASSTSNNQALRSSYYKKVYTGDDQVNVGVFQDHPLKASQLLSSTVLNQKAEEIKLQNASKGRRIEDLSQQNAHLSQQNESKDRELMELRAELDELKGSSSSSRSNMERTKQKHKSPGSSRERSARSQSRSPINSPVKKRHRSKN